MGPRPEVDAVLGPKFGAVEVICRLPSGLDLLLQYLLIMLFIFIFLFLFTFTPLVSPGK